MLVDESSEYVSAPNAVEGDDGLSRAGGSSIGGRWSRERWGRCSLCSRKLGLRLGARLNETLRERAEKLAGLAPVALAGLLVIEKIT